MLAKALFESIFYESCFRAVFQLLLIFQRIFCKIPCQGIMVQVYMYQITVQISKLTTDCKFGHKTGVGADKREQGGVTRPLLVKYSNFDLNHLTFFCSLGLTRLEKQILFFAHLKTFQRRPCKQIDGLKFALLHAGYER